MTVTANFNPCYAVTKAVNPAGSGSVDSITAPNCGAGYSKDTVVQLTATPNTGYFFANWSEDATGTANPTTITMTKVMTVTANFTKRPTLYLSPSAKSIMAGQVFTVEIKGALGAATADTVDAYLGFDSGLLEVVDAAGNSATSIEPAVRVQ